jgi:hypothetical protein
MRFLMPAVLCVLLAVAGGCTPSSHRGDGVDRSAIDTALVNTYADASVDNAILVQHTLYPYHFMMNAAKLNELGQHDLGVLAAYYKDHPGPISVRQGDVAVALYQQRVAEVRRRLVEGGVAEGRISIADAPPGGDGMPSQQLFQILTPKDKAATSTPPAIPTLGTGGTGMTPKGQP